MHYWRVRRYGITGGPGPWITPPAQWLTTAGTAEEFAARFWTRVRTAEPGKCWPWLGSAAPEGYGRVTIRDPGGEPQQELAHRLALSLHLGRPLVGWALHACDNPGCCNPHPGHVYEGSHAQNVADKMARGRQARGPEHAARIREGWRRTGYR